jgi:hypothetical protein
VTGRARLDRLALRVAAALERANLVDVLARRDVAQRKRFPNHTRRRTIQEEDPLNEGVAQSTLEQHRGERCRGDLLQGFAA